MSKFRHLTDREFIFRLDDARHQSPIIGELCRRLEDLLCKEPPTTAQTECPVCMADVQADYDSDSGILELKVST
jgi:hypothetical protein